MDSESGSQIEPMDEPTITEQMEVEERFHREMFDKIPDAVLIVDRQGVIERCNNKATVLLGYERASLVGKDLTETLVPPSVKDHAANIKHYFEDPYTRPMGINLNISVVTKDGEVPVTIHLAPVVHGIKGTMAMAILRRKP